MLFSRLLASVILFAYFATSAHGDISQLDPDEVEALKQIAKTLGKTDWKFDGVDPCSGKEGWVTQNPRNEYENYVTCGSCSSNNNSTLLHITNIDVSLNYLNGTIPPEWASLPLVNISLYGNRITGSIPKEIGNIKTLESLVLEFNQLAGTIPWELGNLSRLKRMYLTSNSFSGELPGTLSNLTSLEEFWIGDNNFTGKIPDFIGNWRNLTQLVIQASGFEGPIPSSIANLTHMTDLRITDLCGTEMAFPPLNDTTNLEKLILRNCNISGTLPDYLGDFNSLKTLDLSFNKLSGAIPSSFGVLNGAKYMFLTGNLLNGPLPVQMQDVAYNKKLDLSYNNFSSRDANCNQLNVNWFASSLPDTASGNVPCINPCPQHWSSFNINCGGGEYKDNNKNYEADTDSSGPSNLSPSGKNWVLSSTGFFLDDERHNHIATNYSRLFMKNSELYTTARISPLSLTYFGSCLFNGNYTVKLHFAEIVFTDDNTYGSLGRRIFDVYIQGKRVLQDFNIEAEAGGIGKETVKVFPAEVTNNTLEIRFYWAGKETTGIPDRGTYGPLISAISVINPDLESSTKHISAGSIVGIVAAVAIFICALLCILRWKGILFHNPMENDLKGLDFKTGSFTLKQIKAATNNFDAANKIGEGGFGSVYKGLLLDGTMIAVKQLSSKSKQGNREFLNEIGMISALQHPHLVKLYGCCVEGSQLLLVYEYMENNSLARALFGPEEHQLKLDWPTRRKICIGIARGLAYLHEESRLKVVHRDIKATNVLLDKDLNPKISDFGLARLDEEENTHISTRVAGTYGYMAPEYAMWGYLTDKADVYSFGIVTHEIVSGKSATSYKTDETFNFLEWAQELKENGNLMELVDPRLESDFNEEEVMVIINVALLCTNATAAVRPSMSSVVSILEGDIVLGPNFSFDDYKTALEKTETFEHSPETKMSDSLISRSISLDEPGTGSTSAFDVYKTVLEKTDKTFEHSPKTKMSDSLISRIILPDGPLTASTSAADLYPVNLGSEYWQKRDG